MQTASNSVNTDNKLKNHPANSEGTQRLQERILAEARFDADSMIENARIRAEEIAKESEREAARIAMEGETRAQAIENEILAKSRTQAEQEAKKHALKTRYKMLDDIFNAAYDRLQAMDPDDKLTLNFIYRLIVQEAKGGEAIHPSQKHMNAVRAVLTRANEELNKTNRSQVTLGDTVQIIDDGFLLVSDKYVKDCSLRSVLEDVREREIVKVSGGLFRGEAL